MNGVEKRRQQFFVLSTTHAIVTLEMNMNWYDAVSWWLIFRILSCYQLSVCIHHDTSPESGNGFLIYDRVMRNSFRKKKTSSEIHSIDNFERKFDYWGKKVTSNRVSGHWARWTDMFIGRFFFVRLMNTWMKCITNKKIRIRSIYVHLICIILFGQEVKLRSTSFDHLLRKSPVLGQSKPMKKCNNSSKLHLWNAKTQSFPMQMCKLA